ncbi:hypothetical protein F5880DRAFT_1615972 [Lentinula raphanica]|nr:hypothetical protein F5880DRAFT_1615972 [Lentinula raphanica]
MPTQFTLKLTGGPTRRLSFTDEPTSSLLAEGIAGLFDIPADPIANFRIHDETTSISDSDSHVSTVMPPRVDKGKGRAKDIDASSTASLVEEKTFEKPDIHVVDVTAHEVTPPLPRLSRRSSVAPASTPRAHVHRSSVAPRTSRLLLVLPHRNQYRQQLLRLMQEILRRLKHIFHLKHHFLNLPLRRLLHTQNTSSLLRPFCLLNGETR